MTRSAPKAGTKQGTPAYRKAPGVPIADGGHVKTTSESALAEQLGCEMYQLWLPGVSHLWQADPRYGGVRLSPGVTLEHARMVVRFAIATRP